jgi:hypothetical protein
VLTFAAITVDQYNYFTLNAAGLAAINTAGITKFAIVSENVRADSPPGTQLDQTNRISITTADHASGNAPQLELYASIPQAILV